MNAQTDSSSYTFSKYSKDSKLISTCTTISLILLFIFVISPLSYFGKLSFIFKLIVFFILAFALYQNLNITYKFTKASNIYYLDGSWSDIKNNMICSYIYSFFIFILLITVVKSIF
jgi:hypothetical protein